MRLKSSNGKFIINDLTGKRFGKLLVVALLPERNKNRQTMWLCKCDCGGEKVVCSGHLCERKGTKSCGCLVDKPAGLTTLIAQYRCRAKKQGYSFTLDDASFCLVTSSPCYYCGVLPTKTRTGTNGDRPYSWNGIDRQDSSQGYELWNCVPCCPTCNFAKSDMTPNEFHAWLDRVSVYHQGRFGEVNAIGEILSQCA